MSKIKICGLSRIQDIEAVNCVLPEFIGFVFAFSRRKIDIKTAAALKEKLNPQIKAVGVFVNEDINIVSKIYRQGIIDLVQLHGDETNDYIKKLKDNCGCQVIKAAGIGKVQTDSTQPDSSLPPIPASADYILFDTLSDQRGGAGKPFDWNVLKGYRELPYFLAGGLSLNNVSGAIDLLSPFCVDVSSGVETDGKKDVVKIENFIYIVRGRLRISEAV
jgi:phosphoribosylanthranilate isomerase